MHIALDMGLYPCYQNTGFMSWLTYMNLTLSILYFYALCQCSFTSNVLIFHYFLSTIFRDFSIHCKNITQKLRRTRIGGCVDSIHSGVKKCRTHLSWVTLEDVTMVSTRTILLSNKLNCPSHMDRLILITLVQVEHTTYPNIQLIHTQPNSVPHTASKQYTLICNTWLQSAHQGLQRYQRMTRRGFSNNICHMLPNPNLDTSIHQNIGLCKRQ